MLEQIVDLRLAWQDLALDGDEIIAKSLNMRRIIWSQGLCFIHDAFFQRNVRRKAYARLLQPQNSV